MTQSSIYVGALVGYILFSFYSDNYGRRTAMLIGFAFATIGAIIMACSPNLPTVALGLFLLGAGADASINMCFNFMGEMVENQTRQKYCVLLQPWFAIGAIIITTAFKFIENWRIVTICFITIPSVIILFFIAIYIEETPQFLIRKNP
jgi:MFS family permease